MKSIVNILLVVAQFASVYSTDSVSADDCNLGVMQVDMLKLPEGVAATDVRRCAAHPVALGHSRDQENESLLPMSSGSFSPELRSRAATSKQSSEKACIAEALVGCNGNNYCWKTCSTTGGGEWCWLATQGGVGPWAVCNTWEDCTNPSFGCGGACGC